MSINRRLVCFASGIVLLVGNASSQDAPSLGAVARQQRAQKEQSKAAPAKDAKVSSTTPSKVVTNDELSKSPAPAEPASVSTQSPATKPTSSEQGKPSTEDLKSEILAQKDQIAAMQAQIDQFNDTIHFASANCVSNCAQWNERQVAKQRQVEGARSQLEELKKHLEEMQESARKQGLGSSVYEP